MTPLLVSFVLFFVVPSVLSVTVSLHSYLGYGPRSRSQRTR
jgi:ABC-type sugar transport system permease subunit